MDDYGLDAEDLDGFLIIDLGAEASEDYWSYPEAGPVTVTRADGSTTVEAPLDGGDQPAS